MKMQFLTVAAAALMAAPMLHAQATTPVAPTPSGARSARGARAAGGHNGMVKNLDLSADQKARMKAIHAKYAPEMKAARDASKPDMDALKAARASHDTAAMRVARTKMQADMAPSMKVRQQETAEMRAVLTPAQQQKFDAQRAQMKQRKGEKGKRAGWMGKHTKGTGQQQPAKPLD